MTLPDPAANRQPRRIGLYAPFALLLLGIAIWSVVWLWMRNTIVQGIASERESLAKGGYTLQWSARRISGYPFRLDVDLSDITVASSAGWRMSIPSLAAEAMVLTPAHWVVAVPSDIVITQRDGQTVSLRSNVLRASLSDAGDHPPKLSVEGLGLKVIGSTKANPFWFTSADELHVHTKAGPDDQGAAYLELDGAKAPFTGFLAQLVEGKPTTLTADVIYSHAAALSGSNWRTSVKAWRAAGGVFSVRTLHMSTDTATLNAKPGALAVDDDGRLTGSLFALIQTSTEIPTMAGQPRATLPDANRRSPGANTILAFTAGQTTLGPIVIGPAPRAY